MPVPTSIDELSPIPVDNYPVGTEPVFPNLDNYIRSHAAFIAQLRDRLNLEGIPLTSVMWWGGARSAIASRMQPLDGQVLLRADYPTLWSFLAAGSYPMVSEASWQSGPTLRASFSSGDGVTTFRMPDLNGKQTNSIGAVTVRGDGAGAASASGQMQDSQNLQHRHTASVGAGGGHGHPVSGQTDEAPDHIHTNADGGYLVALAGGGWSGRAAGPNSGSTGAAGRHMHVVTGTAAPVSDHTHTAEIADSGGNEARMKVATGAWVMRVK